MGVVRKWVGGARAQAGVFRRWSSGGEGQEVGLGEGQDVELRWDWVRRSSDGEEARQCSGRQEAELKGGARGETVRGRGYQEMGRRQSLGGWGRRKTVYSCIIYSLCYFPYEKLETHFCPPLYVQTCLIDNVCRLLTM